MLKLNLTSIIVFSFASPTETFTPGAICGRNKIKPHEEKNETTRKNVENQRIKQLKHTWLSPSTHCFTFSLEVAIFHNLFFRAL